MLQIKEKNIAIAIILSIVTCGIYGLYWFVTLTDDTNAIAETEGTTGVMALVLTIVTCGIYGWYWAYQMGAKVDIMKQKNGEPASSSSILFIILQICGLGIVNYCIIQSEINKFATPAA